MNLSAFVVLSISLLLAAATGLASSRKTWQKPKGHITMGTMLKAIHAQNKRLSIETQICKKLEVITYCFIINGQL